MNLPTVVILLSLWLIELPGSLLKICFNLAEFHFDFLLLQDGGKREEYAPERMADCTDRQREICRFNLGKPGENHV